ncbi:LuxR C-terminal-related transcriptional regulator [Bradyrhizobium monzae]|uniref:LuxR C-terminal-related transcriptional regulator n=1 Tax=Bradyrhizobium sp. Oc8 TaxID=2876780 RepID=UPI001F2A1F10|nr:LuxR C-terminal-related transcriptional regulator [Bradyrhizobium sp. Oc8]
MRVYSLLLSAVKYSSAPVERGGNFRNRCVGAMNRPIFEQPTEREFLLAQLSPDVRRRVRDFMRENRATASDAILMLGIGRPDASGIASDLEVTGDEREFMLSQLSSHERTSVERTLILHPEWKLCQCIALVRDASAGVGRLDGTMSQPSAGSPVRNLLLSPREKQLLRRLAAGKTDAQIARRLGGTAKQIAEQRVRLLAKLSAGASADIADAAERLASCRTYRGVT